MRHEAGQASRSTWLIAMTLNESSAWACASGMALRWERRAKSSTRTLLRAATRIARHFAPRESVVVMVTPPWEALAIHPVPCTTRRSVATGSDEYVASRFAMAASCFVSA